MVATDQFESVTTEVVKQSNTSALELGKKWGITLDDNNLALYLAQNKNFKSDLQISENTDGDVADFISETKLNKVDSAIRGQQVLYFEHKEQTLSSDVATYDLGVVTNFELKLDEDRTNPFADGNLVIVSSFVSDHSTVSDGGAQYTITIPDNGVGDLFRARNHRRNIWGSSGSESYTSDLSGFKVEPNNNFNTDKAGFNPNEFPVISSDSNTFGLATWATISDVYNITLDTFEKTSSSDKLVYDIQYASDLALATDPTTGVYRITPGTATFTVTGSAVFDLPFAQNYASDITVVSDRQLTNLPNTGDLNENNFFNVLGLGSVREKVGSGYNFTLTINSDGGYTSSDSSLFTVNYSGLKNSNLYYVDNTVNSEHKVIFDNQVITLSDSLSNYRYHSSDGSNSSDKKMYLVYNHETLGASDADSNLTIVLSSTVRNVVESSDRLTVDRQINYPDDNTSDSVLHPSDLVNGLVQYKVTEIFNETNDDNRLDSERLDTFRIRNNNHELHYLLSSSDAPQSDVVVYQASETLVTDSAYMIYLNNTIKLSSDEDPLYNASDLTYSSDFTGFVYTNNPGETIIQDFINRNDNRIVVNMRTSTDILGDFTEINSGAVLELSSGSEIKSIDRRTGVNRFSESWGKSSKIVYTINWKQEGISQDDLQNEYAVESITVSGITSDATLSSGSQIGITRDLTIEPLNITILNYQRGSVTETLLDLTSDVLSFNASDEVNVNIDQVKVYKVTRTDTFKLRFDPLLDGYNNLQYTTETLQDKLEYYIIKDDDVTIHMGDQYSGDLSSHEFYLRALRVNGQPIKSRRLSDISDNRINNFNIKFNQNAFRNATYNRVYKNRSDPSSSWENGTGLTNLTGNYRKFIDTRDSNKLNPENANLFLSFRSKNNFEFMGSSIYHIELNADTNKINQSWSATKYNFGNVSSNLQVLENWQLSSSSALPNNISTVPKQTLDVTIEISNNQSFGNEETVTIKLRNTSSGPVIHQITLKSYMMSSFWIFGFSGQVSRIDTTKALDAVGTGSTTTKYQLINNTMTEIDLGVYVKYTSTPKAVKVSANYPNVLFKLLDNVVAVDLYGSASNQTVFTNTPTHNNNTEFIFSSSGSVDAILKWRRGYQNTSITGVRGRTTATVTIGNYTQVFSNVFAGKEVTLDTLVNGSNTMDLGLVLTFHKSLINDNSNATIPSVYSSLINPRSDTFNPVASTGSIIVENPLNFTDSESLRTTINFDLKQTGYLYQLFGIYARRPVSNGSYTYTLNYERNALVIERNSDYKLNLTGAVSASYSAVETIHIWSMDNTNTRFFNTSRNKLPAIPIGNSFRIQLRRGDTPKLGRVFYVWVTPPQVGVSAVSNVGATAVVNNGLNRISNWNFVDSATTQTLFSNSQANPTVSLVSSGSNVLRYHAYRMGTSESQTTRFIDIRENNLNVTLYRGSTTTDGYQILDGRISDKTVGSNVGGPVTSGNGTTGENYSSLQNMVASPTRLWNLDFEQQLVEINAAASLIDTSLGVTQNTDLVNMRLVIDNTMVKSGSYTLYFNPLESVQPYLYHASTIYETKSGHSNVDKIVRRVYKYEMNPVNYNSINNTTKGLYGLYRLQTDNASDIVSNQPEDDSFIRVGFSIKNIEYKDYLIPTPSGRKLKDRLQAISGPVNSSWTNLLSANTSDLLATYTPNSSVSSLNFTAHGQTSIQQLLRLIYATREQNKLLYVNCKDLYRANDILGNTMYAISYNGTVYANRITSEVNHLNPDINENAVFRQSSRIRDLLYHNSSIQHLEVPLFY